MQITIPYYWPESITALRLGIDSELQLIKKAEQQRGHNLRATLRDLHTSSGTSICYMLCSWYNC